MLIPDVLAEVLRFFDRRYLTELQLHGRGLRDIVDAACPKYPLARLALITIRVCPPGSAVVEMVNNSGERIDTDTVDFFDAVRDVKELMQKSYVRLFVLCARTREEIAPITMRQWSALVPAIQSASIGIIDLIRMDLTDVEADQLKQILGASRLEEVMLRWCRIRAASISDAFLTLCRDNGVTSLLIHHNELTDGPNLSVTEEAIFDYCFRADGRHRDTVIQLTLHSVLISNSFLRRFMKMMEDSQSGRRFVCDFAGLNALPRAGEFGQYEWCRSSTGVIFRIPLSHSSHESFHRLHYACAST